MSAPEVEKVEKDPQRGDLACPVRHADEAQRQAARRRERVDERDRRGRAHLGQGAAQALAVKRHGPIAGGLRQAGREPGQAGREGGRIEQPEQPRERVVRGHAALQTQELAEELLLRAGKQLEVDAARRPAQRRRERNRQELEQVMPSRVAAPRIGKNRIDEIGEGTRLNASTACAMTSADTSLMNSAFQ